PDPAHGLREEGESHILLVPVCRGLLKAGRERLIDEIGQPGSSHQPFALVGRQSPREGGEAAAITLADLYGTLVNKPECPRSNLRYFLRRCLLVSVDLDVRGRTCSRSNEDA